MALRGQFSSLDTLQVAQELNKSIINHRMNNFYDVGVKTFVMRFGAADSKHRVVFEPGLRCHATEVDHEKPKIPSHFTLIIRKNIRGWRIRSVTQVGRDRILDFAFGGAADEPPQFHLFIELWGQGNVVLTDGSSKIVTMWRSMKSSSNNNNTDKDGNSSNNNNNNKQQAGKKNESGDKNKPAEQQPTTATTATGSTNKQVGDLYLPDGFPPENQQQNTSSAFTQVTKDSLVQTFLKHAEDNSPLSLNSILPSVVYGPQLMKHIALTAGGIDLSKSVPKLLSAAKINNEDDEKKRSFLSEVSEKLAAGFSQVDRAYGVFSSPDAAAGAALSSASSSSVAAETGTPGAFAFSNKSAANASQTDGVVQQYLSFAKLPLKQFTSNPNNFSVTPTPNFCAAADLLFSAEERKKLADIAKKQPTAQSREERVRAAIQRRIVELENEGAQRRKCANALLLASDEVDKVIRLLSDALALGTPWKTLTEAIRRQREAAAEAEEKKKNKMGGDGNMGDEDDDDDQIDLGSSSDDDDGEDLFLESDEETDDDDDEDDGSDYDNSDNDSEDPEAEAKARAADEQRYLLSLIYALDLRKNQMTLQLPDPDHSFDYSESDDDDEEKEENDVDEDDRLDNGPKLVLVVVDIGLSAHDNATKYFELAKKADRSKSKTEDKEDEAVANAKKSGKKDNNSKNNKKGGKDSKDKISNEANKKKNVNLAKQREAASERVPAWFERHYWFVTSAGDLVVMPKDAGQADVLIQKFANKSQDVAVLVDQFGSWPTIVKPRKGVALATTTNTDSNDDDNSNVKLTISQTSLLEAAAATLCRSNVSNGWTSTKAAASAQLKTTNNSNSNKKGGGGKNNNNNKGNKDVSAPSSSGSSSCVWCPVASLTKTPEQGSGIKQLPQGAFTIANPSKFKKPLQLAFSSQLCVALVEASGEGPVSCFDNISSNGNSEEQNNTIDISTLAKKAEEENVGGNTTAPMLAERMTSTNSSSMMMQAQQQSTSSTSATMNPQLSDQALKRQQKKAKMIQKKYGEQDEEDRAIALALIGTKKSKAQQMLEEEEKEEKEQKQQQSSKTTSNKKKSKKNEDDDNNDDDEDKNENPSTNEDEGTNDKNDKSNNNTKTQKQQQQQQPRQLSDEAQKNLQDKIQTAASEFMTMKYVDSSSASFSSSSSSSTRYLVPVLVPLLTMPLNKCRVLLVPGSEKRSELAKELQTSFFQSLAEHLVSKDSEKFGNFTSLVSDMTNDDILLQLPMTGKIQTPFRASLV